MPVSGQASHRHSLRHSYIAGFASGECQVGATKLLPAEARNSLKTGFHMPNAWGYLR
jgi:hypothetical protein